MTSRTVLVATWDDGVFAFGAQGRGRDLEGERVCCLAPAGAGRALAIVAGREVRQRSAEGAWRSIARLGVDAACCTAVGGAIYVGTDDAQVLRVASDGEVEALSGFHDTPGRELWYAGRALVDGRWIGPPLGVRSIAATCDGAALLANVHVGGVPRSADGGKTWRPTIEIEHDVHEVLAHPSRPDVVAAATASGLALSRDGGETWELTTRGLDAPYSSAVAFLGDEVLVASSEQHFAERGAVYRGRLDGRGPLRPLGGDGGLPRWTHGIVDTRCVSALGACVAFGDGRGDVWVSEDSGDTWWRAAESLPAPSGVLVL